MAMCHLVNIKSKLISVVLTLCTITLVIGQDFEITFSLPEESDRWTFIGNVSTASGFMDFVPVADRNELSFSFLEQTNIKSMLSIHDETGSLYTTVVIDRESLDECKSTIPSPCVLSFDIAAVSKVSSLFEIISVNVIVEDKNDNLPTFPRDVQVIEIKENINNGSVFDIYGATDEDTGSLNSIQNYELVGNADVFALNVSRKLDGSLSVKLVVIAKLDHETKEFYNCTIFARDGGKPQRSGKMRLDIKILDENDNAPYLMQTSYNITINENIELHTGILQIQARDKDIGNNGKILYRFSPHQSEISMIRVLFAINENTGIMSVIGRLVHEPGKDYRIIVEALDQGNPPLMSSNQAIVIVNVKDTGNNAPIVRINLLSAGSGKVVNVSELAVEGTFVAHVDVTDKDTGDNGVVSCHINGDLFKLETMPGGKGYKAVVKSTLDREKQDIHTVLVTCRDHGTPVQSSSASFLVRVTDENDLVPTFAQSTYTEYLYEHNDKNDVVITVSARDDDLGKNGDVKYYLDPNDGTYFKIDPYSGVIRANHVFDRETTPVVKFKVYATDFGTPQLVGNATIEINIKDRNDNPPVFSLSVFKFSVDENEQANTLVDRLTANDTDRDENAVFTFALADSNQKDLPFVVYPNGKIKTNRELDRERKNRYMFAVIAVDKGIPKLTGTATVIVDIDDVNDHKPTVEFPTENNKTADVLHMSPKGTVISHIIASDKDVGENAKLSYVIEEGNVQRLFLLDFKTGVLSMSKAVVVEKDETFTLVISVHDSGIPQQSTRCELIVTIKYSNETISQQTGDESSNTAIVIVVTLVTAFLSVAIIIVICVIRKFDRDRLKSQNMQITKLPNNFTEMQDTTMQNGMVQSRSYDQVDLHRKKKEVSFSFEDDLDTLDHEISYRNDDTVFAENIEPQTPVHDRQNSQLRTFHMQQALLGTAPPHVWNQQHKSHDVKHIGGHPEDNNSDTSRETVTSDSGRGGSEDDLPLSHNNSKEIKDGQLPGSTPHIMRCSVPNTKRKRRGVSPERTQSVIVEERASNNRQFDCSQSNLVNSSEKPKFTVRKPYIDREVRDKKAQSESWVPSYV